MKESLIIAVDASRATIGQRTGTEGYSLQIIQQLLEQGKQHRFRLYFRDEPPDDLFPTAENIECRVILKRRLWTHTGLGPAIRREKPDVLFVPSHVVPWPGIGIIPVVVTVHDMGYLHYPDKHPLFDRLYLSWSTRYSAERARRVIAISQATRHDLVALNQIAQDKIEVIYSGVDSLLRPVKSSAEIDTLKERLGIPGPYILHVGSLQARKNLSRLVDAFDHIKDLRQDLTLVLAGRQGWGYQQLQTKIQKLGLSGRVILPGYIPDKDLSALYSGALAYVFPSLYEGFGFPALEAMACEVPVICSNTSSLPEIVGNAALMFAPTDVKGLADHLEKVLTDGTLRDDLIQRGKEQIKQFTWEATARQTLDILTEAANI